MDLEHARILGVKLQYKDRVHILAEGIEILVDLLHDCQGGVPDPRRIQDSAYAAIDKIFIVWGNCVCTLRKRADVIFQSIQATKHVDDIPFRCVADRDHNARAGSPRDLCCRCGRRKIICSCWRNGSESRCDRWSRFRNSCKRGYINAGDSGSGRLTEIVDESPRKKQGKTKY